MVKRTITILLFVILSALSAQEQARNIPPGSQVKLRLTTGEEIQGRLLAASSQSVDLELVQGNQITIREVAHTEIVSMTREASAARVATVLDFARRLPPGTPVHIRLSSGQKVEGRVIRVSGQALELDLTRGNQMAHREVAFADIQTMQVREPQRGHHLIKALGPAWVVVYLATQVAKAF